MRWWHGYFALWAVCLALVLKDLVPVLPSLSLEWPTRDAWAAVFAYVLSMAVLSLVLPGKLYTGVALADGTRLTYKCNGLLVTGASVTALATAHWNGFIRASWAADHYAQLFVAANLFALALSLYLLVKGRLSRAPNWLKPRSLVDDFVMGAELNPFVAGIDVKFFSYRPAMAGWLLINLSFLVKQYEVLGFVTSRMLLFQLTTAWYIWDYFVHEPKMITTWDIIAEHFGLMLVWGDYVFIIFGFSLQNFFLLRDTQPVTYTHGIVTGLVFWLGFAIFRGANSQKHQFKTNPTAPIWGKTPAAIGGKLLVSGFWGIGRHLNYTGDLLLAISFCAPCGTRTSVAYFYFFYLLLLTVHREKRDEERCAEKYKALWDEYCLHVPYRMLPFVY